MRPRRDPVPRAREAWWWLGGLLTLGFLGGAVVVAGIALWENIDIRRLTPGLAEAPPPVPAPALPAPPASVSGGFDAVLLRSEANAGYFEDATYYSTEVEIWKELVEGVGGRVREAHDAEELAATNPGELMVLPEAPCLSSEELAAVGSHIRRGGSVATNWALGVRDGSCEWRGWSTLLDLVGADDIREIPARQGLYLTVPGGLPVSPGIDPGTRIELRPDPSLALRMEGERVFWSDWALNPAPDPEGALADVAVATVRTEEGGRVTWFGLRTRQAATPADSTRLHVLLENGLRWAGGVPFAAPSAWPEAAQAALLFSIDVEGEGTYVNARDAAAAFRTEGLPITFFAVSRLVEEDESLARALVDAGEVGTQTVDHAPLAGLTAQDQMMRLRRSWNDIESWTGIGPAGLRPPEEAIDGFTLEAWAGAGGRYVLAANEARSGSPEIHATDEGPVVLLPRLLKDDYAIVVRDVTLRSRTLAGAYQAGVRKLRAIGGLAVVAGHTQIISAGPRLDALLSVADSVRAQDGWWIARADEIADWWLARSRVELRWEGGEAGGVGDLLVSVPSGTTLDDLWIDVVAPELDPRTVSLVDGISVDFLEEPWGRRIRVGSLDAGAVKRVSFAPPPDEESESGR